MQHDGAAHRADLVTGLTCAVIGVSVVAYALSLPTLGEGKPGPGLFPGIVGGAFILFGLVLATQALSVRRRRKHAERTGLQSDDTGVGEGRPRRAELLDVPGRRLAGNAAVVILAVVAYIFLAEILGFLITMFCVTVAVMLSLRATLRSTVVAAVILSLLMWVVFEKLLLVQLPDGLLV